MSAEIERIRRKLFPPDSERQHQVFQCTVKDVNEQEFTCTVREADLVDYFDVRLRAVIDQQLTGVALIPKVGSYVMVGRIANSNELFIAKNSEISKIVYTAGENKKVSFSAGFELDESGKEISDKPTLELQWGEKIAVSIDEETIKLTNDQSTFEMKGDKIALNEGQDGLVMIGELTEKLNKLVDVFNKHTHLIGPITVDPNSHSVDSVNVPATTISAEKCTRNDYENTHIKQNNSK